MPHRSVSHCPLPASSGLHQRIRKGDFMDCYATQSDMDPRRAAEIITSFPGWAQMLVHLRNVLTAPFGLRSTAPPASDIVGIFPVESENENELIAGFNDKHLDFRVSVLREAGRVHLATWVHPHNIGGRLYLATIMPFHILIARDALARVAQAG